MNSSLRILLADDSRFFRTIEAKFLQKTPAQILEAEDCASVLSVMRQQKPDLVYMAFSLVPDGGVTCCSAIKQDPQLADIPVVMICDQGEPDQPGLARRSGADDHLCKPLDRHTFLQVGRKFLAGIREHRQPSFFSLSFSFGDETFTGKCLDISGGGIFIETQLDIPPGTEIPLTFKLPDIMATKVECTVKVSWLNRKPNVRKPHYPHGFGATFVNLPASIHKAIAYLSNKKPSA